jgi:hypothetical protein
MCVEERMSRKGNVMFWAAMCVMPLTILSSGHGRLQHLLTGAAAAIFIVGVVGMARQRRCLR